NIMTAEDPVEYNLKGVNQLQVNDEIGRTFAAALRSFLRQDPDVVLVGETRDLETAQIAIRAALTGHLVLTTVHTNDCPSTVARPPGQEQPGEGSPERDPDGRDVDALLSEQDQEADAARADEEQAPVREEERHPEGAAPEARRAQLELPSQRRAQRRQRLHLI